MREQEREQRITLKVEDITLKLVVPASQESYYRKAANDLTTTVSLYRMRYPHQDGMPNGMHLLMASVDVAYRSQLWREAVELRGLTERLNTLSASAEATWLKHRHLLAELEQDSQSSSTADGNLL